LTKANLSPWERIGTLAPLAPLKLVFTWKQKHMILFDIIIKILTPQMRDYHFGNVMQFLIPY
jgi:hypothetical protein